MSASASMDQQIREGRRRPSLELTSLSHPMRSAQLKQFWNAICRLTFSSSPNQIPNSVTAFNGRPFHGTRCTTLSLHQQRTCIGCLAVFYSHYWGEGGDRRGCYIYHLSVVVLTTPADVLLVIDLHAGQDPLGLFDRRLIIQYYSMGEAWVGPDPLRSKFPCRNGIFYAAIMITRIHWRGDRSSPPGIVIRWY